jgi:D-alanine-D-alanine ligase
LKDETSIITWYNSKMFKIKIAVVFGGKSPEHEVSLESAKNVIAAINREKYEVIEIKIEKDGDLSSLFQILNKEKGVVVFPVLHGTFGEDGTIQGMLKLMNIPFVGAGVLGSAIGMDKEIARRLLNEAGIPTPKFIVLTRTSKKSFEEIKSKLKLPFFVKPANLGSSVGDNKVKTELEFNSVVEEAFKYDNKVLIDEFIKCREIECSVLGNEEVVASIPGEIIVSKDYEFYSYEAKYLDKNGAKLQIPAKLDNKEINEIQKLAIKTFKTLQCEGMGRVDFFLRENGELLVNEINTIPGFTKISMYPKLWEASGISYPELIDKLITLAIERSKRDEKLKTTMN